MPKKNKKNKQNEEPVTAQDELLNEESANQQAQENTDTKKEDPAAIIAQLQEQVEHEKNKYLS